MNKVDQEKNGTDIFLDIAKTIALRAKLHFKMSKRFYQKWRFTNLAVVSRCGPDLGFGQTPCNLQHFSARPPGTHGPWGRAGVACLLPVPAGSWALALEGLGRLMAPAPKGPGRPARQIRLNPRIARLISRTAFWHCQVDFFSEF